MPNSPNHHHLLKKYCSAHLQKCLYTSSKASSRDVYISHLGKNLLTPSNCKASVK